MEDLPHPFQQPQAFKARITVDHLPATPSTLMLGQGSLASGQVAGQPYHSPWDIETQQLGIMHFHNVAPTVFPMLVVKNPTTNAGEVKRHRLNPWADPLKEGMATHSSILAWKIPQTEEPGGLQSTG